MSLTPNACELTGLLCIVVGGQDVIIDTHPLNIVNIHTAWVILHFSTFYTTAVMGQLGFRVGVSASYSYFHLSLNNCAECVLSAERLRPRY